eukprot:1580705-Lingulodinium_polyedra.AAC.1
MLALGNSQPMHVIVCVCKDEARADRQQCAPPDLQAVVRLAGTNVASNRLHKGEALLLWSSRLETLVVDQCLGVRAGRNADADGVREPAGLGEVVVHKAPDAVLPHWNPRCRGVGELHGEEVDACGVRPGVGHASCEAFSVELLYLAALVGVVACDAQRPGVLDVAEYRVGVDHGLGSQHAREDLRVAGKLLCSECGKLS